MLKLLLSGSRLTRVRSSFLALHLAFYAAVFWVVRNLKQSALGRVLVAIREDESFCQSLGKNVGLAKLQ